MNINEHVVFKLTEAGLVAWKKEAPYAQPDANGRVRAQLWDVMRIFGPLLHMGLAKPLIEGNSLEMPDVDVSSMNEDQLRGLKMRVDERLSLWVSLQTVDDVIAASCGSRKFDAQMPVVDMLATFRELGIEWTVKATKFTECDECRKKPGAPVLCDRCLERRRKLTDG